MKLTNENAPREYAESALDMAVIINANAGNASRRVVNNISQLVPAENIFISTDKDSCREQLHIIMERRYSRLAIGGGDGTLAFIIEDLFNAMNERRAALLENSRNGKGAGEGAITPSLPPSLPSLPLLLVLKMGTGNALASHVGARHVINDLEQVITGKAAITNRKLGLMEVDGRLSFFAGMGLDAMIAADYADLRKELSTTALKGSFKGLGAYWGAIMTRTMPRVMREKYANVRIINNGSIAYQVNSKNGLTEKTFYKDDVLYDGRCLIACAGTFPYYGFNMRMFPHASRLPGFFQLKIASTGLAETLASMPGVWRGTMMNENIKDILASEVSLQFSRDVPIQVSGDPDGWRSNMTIRMYPHTIDLISFPERHFKIGPSR